MNTHCMQIIQMVKKNTSQMYTNISLPNSMYIIYYMDMIKIYNYQRFC